jgi:hypothetical protein
MIVIQVYGSTGVTLAYIFSEVKRKYEIIRSLLWIVNLDSESFSDLKGVCKIKTLEDFTREKAWVH